MTSAYKQDVILVLRKFHDKYEAVNAEGIVTAESNKRDFVINYAIDGAHLLFIDSSFKEKVTA